MLTVIKDKAAEAAFTSRRDGVCLFSYEEDEEGKGRLTVIPMLADLLLKHFADNPAPLSSAALASLDACLRPRLAAHGYAPDRGNRDVYRAFCKDPTDFSSKSTKMSTVFLKMGDNYQNATTIDLPRALGAGAIAYGYIEGGCILSLAVAYLRGGESTAEITLETAPTARGRGYGKAVLADLVRALADRGISALYRAKETNTPSLRAARAVGFREVGIYYRYLGRRN